MHGINTNAEQALLSDVAADCGFTDIRDIAVFDLGWWLDEGGLLGRLGCSRLGFSWWHGASFYTPAGEIIQQSLPAQFCPRSLPVSMCCVRFCRCVVFGAYQPC